MDVSKSNYPSSEELNEATRYLINIFKMYSGGVEDMKAPSSTGKTFSKAVRQGFQQAAEQGYDQTRWRCNATAITESCQPHPPAALGLRQTALTQSL